MAVLLLMATGLLFMYVVVLCRTGLQLARSERFQPGWRPWVALGVLGMTSLLWLGLDWNHDDASMLALSGVSAALGLAMLYVYRRSPGPSKKRR